MESDLKICYDAMQGKQAEHTLRWRYYDGNHPIAFINPKMKEVIPNGVVFKKNLCQVIVNSTRDRLRVQAWNTKDEGASTAMGDLWKKLLRRISGPVHVASLTTGEAFVIAWPDKTTQKPKAYYHDPRQVHVIYDEDDPDTIRCAAKQWCAGKHWYLNLYYPDRIEHYEATSEPSVHSAYQLKDAEANPYRVIPVFHFRLNQRVNTGELTLGVLSLQDAMNKLLNDMMVSSEFSSFPQRWGIGNWAEGPIPIGPGTILKLPAGAQDDEPSKLGAFPTTDPGNYLEPIDNLQHAIAILSATPKHFFTGQGGDPSGEALQAMEAPLIAKVMGYQEILGETWQQLMTFVMKLQGATIDYEDIECLWEDPHTVQLESQATTRLTNTQAGIPIVNILRDEGWTEVQLDQLREDQAASLTMRELAASQPANQPTPAVKPATSQAVKEQTATGFAGIVRTPDIANQLASTGALSRAVSKVAG